MRMREDEHQQPPTAPPQPGAEGSTPTLREIAQQSAALAAAGQAIIQKALSGDSQAFLQLTRQSGGQ